MGLTELVVEGRRHCWASYRASAGAHRPGARGGRMAGGGRGLGKAEKQEYTWGVEAGEEAGVAEQW